MTATLTIWGKLTRKMIVHPEEIFGFMIQPVLWMVLFGVGMKSLLALAVPGGGDNYITFILPGIVALTALGGAVGGGAAWQGERILGIVKEYIVAPIPRLSILSGNAASTVSKSLLQALIIFIVGALMGASFSGTLFGWLEGFLLVAGYSLGFAGISLAVASKTDDPGAYHMMIMMLNLPLLFLSNALYPLDSLPAWMKIGALANPTTYVVDGLRQTVLDSGGIDSASELMPLWLSFLVVAGFALLGMGMAYAAFKKSIR
jgi:ABC-2 type transport system permease protein